MISFLISAIKIIFLLGFLILIHEFGHFSVAKLFKVKVNEFSIGFGKTILKKQGKETLYALRLIPLGGYVSMEGEDTYSNEEHSFCKTNIFKRIAIVAAGGIVNILFAIILFFCLSLTFGDFNFAILNTKYFLISIIDNLRTLFLGNVTIDQMVGPVGISNIVAQTNGLKEFVYILSLISLSLGITNLLPFPPLDGGKIVLLIIEGIRRKPLKESIETGIQTVGFFILIFLSICVTYNDILRIF